MNIIELETFKEEYVAGLDALMHELSPGATATEELRKERDECIYDEIMIDYENR